MVPVEIKKKRAKRPHNKLLIQKQKRGYGEIGRRYGLNWIEPWYGNLLSDNFQIQRNLGINKKGNPEPNPIFEKLKNKRLGNRKK